MSDFFNSAGMYDGGQGAGSVDPGMSGPDGTPMPAVAQPAAPPVIPSAQSAMSTYDPNEDLHRYFDGGVSPMIWGLGTVIGEQAKSRGVRDDLVTNALNGLTPTEVVDQEQQQSAEQKRAAQMADLQKQMQDAAAQTVHLDDTQFNRYKDALTNELSRTMTVPGMPSVTQPGWGQAAVALGGILAGGPHFAFDVAAQPFNYQLMVQGRNYQRDMAQFESDQQARRLKIDTLNHFLSDQNQRDLAQFDEDQKRRALQVAIPQDVLNRLSAEQVAQINATGRESVKMIDGQYRSKNSLQLQYTGGAHGDLSVEERNAARTMLLQGWPEEYSQKNLPAATTENAKQTQATMHGQLYGIEGKVVQQRADANDRIVAARVKVFAGLAKMDEANATRIAKLTSYMDDDHAMAIAKAEMAIKEGSSRIFVSQAGLKLKAQQIDGKTMTDLAANIRGGLGAYHNEIVNVAQQQKDAQAMAMLETDPVKKKLFQDKAAALQEEIGDANSGLTQQYNELAKRGAVLSDAIAEHQGKGTQTLSDLGHFPDFAPVAIEKGKPTKVGAPGGAPQAQQPKTVSQWLNNAYGYVPKVTLAEPDARKLINDAIVAVQQGKDKGWVMHELEKMLAGGK